jgi:hypothetical protein
MSRWTCPNCEREFARAHQAHVCVPGGTVDESFDGRPPVQRDIYDELLAHLRESGPVHEDAVRVGVFLSSDRKLAEVRPQARALSLMLFLPRVVEHPRIARRIEVSVDRTVHVVKLVAVADVDADVRAWLTEAYAAATT